MGEENLSRESTTAARQAEPPRLRLVVCNITQTAIEEPVGQHYVPDKGPAPGRRTGPERDQASAKAESTRTAPGEAGSTPFYVPTRSRGAISKVLDKHYILPNSPTQTSQVAAAPAETQKLDNNHEVTLRNNGNTPSEEVERQGAMGGTGSETSRAPNLRKQYAAVNDHRKLGLLVKAAREAAGMTQEELVRAVKESFGQKISIRTLSRIEAGTTTSPRTNTLTPLLEATGHELIYTLAPSK